jgi:hypothetical protein
MTLRLLQASEFGPGKSISPIAGLFAVQQDVGKKRR